MNVNVTQSAAADSTEESLHKYDGEVPKSRDDKSYSFATISKASVIIILLLTLFLTGCDKINDTPEGDLELISEITLHLPEPSALAFTHDKNSLWTVSDQTGKIYELSFDGNILDEIDVDGEDMEGITQGAGNIIAVVYEQWGIVEFDTMGNELRRQELVLGNEYNLGLEGITYNNKNGHYYVVNQKSPRIVVELDNNLNETARFDLDFSADLSDIFYEENENVYWIVSHESSNLVKYDSSFKEIKTYNLHLQQAEGVVVDFKNKRVYAVSDADNMFAVYRLIN